jgi:hypothetical protein
VAEDPVRNGRLPPDIAAVTRTIIRPVKRESGETLQEQLDYALRLVSWSCLEVKDTMYGGTPLGWAEHGKPLETAECLRDKRAR